MKRQPNSDWCFVCGRRNPVGLQMSFYDNDKDEVFSDYTVPAHYQSYPGVVHGGILASMLDEVVARVSMIENPHRFMMSVRLEAKYRLPVPVETPIRIESRIIRLKSRLGKARGQVLLADGRVACEAEMSLANIPTDVMGPDKLAELGWRIDR